jgi:hypothetical protein
VARGAQQAGERAHADAARGDEVHLHVPKTSITASWMRGRGVRMRSLSRRGWVRLVRSVTRRSRSRSIQIDVPVKPRWPTGVPRHARPASTTGRRRRVPAERPRESSTVASSSRTRDDLLRDEVVSAAEAGEEAARERVDVARVGEQARVARRRRPSPRRCRRAPRRRAPCRATGSAPSGDHVDDRREPPRAELRQVDERRRAEPERPRDALVDEAVERDLREELDHGAERMKPRSL